MKKYIIILAGLLFSVSCTEKLIKPPGNLIPKDQMINILKDVAIVNAAKSNGIEVLTNNGINPTDYILKKYAIDSAQFVDSDRYYASLPLEYEAIYVAIEEQLDKKKEQLEEEKKISDSLRLINKKTKSEIKGDNLKDSNKVKNIQE